MLLLGQQPVCKSWQVFLQMSQLVPLRLNQANGLEFTFLFFFVKDNILIESFQMSHFWQKDTRQ